MFLFLKLFIWTSPRGLSAGYHISKCRFDLPNKHLSLFSRHRLKVDSHLAEADLLQNRFSLTCQKHKLLKICFELDSSTEITEWLVERSRMAVISVGCKWLKQGGLIS